MPSISLATVYNCLETLVDCGLARQVNVEREATRYCANLQEHGHFMLQRAAAQVHDVPLASGKRLERLWGLPDGLDRHPQRNHPPRPLRRLRDH